MLDFPNLAKSPLTNWVKDLKAISTDFTEIFGGDFGDFSLLEFEGRLKLKTVVFFFPPVSKWIGSALIEFHGDIVSEVRKDVH